MPERVTAVVHGLIAKIYSPIDAKDAIKLVPGRKWLPLEKCWSIPIAGIPELQYWLEQDGFELKVVNKPKLKTTPSGPTWADAMFSTLPPQLSDKAYKALVKILHPDGGGDSEAMKILNAAYDRHKGK